MPKLEGQPAARRIRWGILSTARIARQRVVPALHEEPVERGGRRRVALAGQRPRLRRSAFDIATRLWLLCRN